jgi:hypothetical protein
MNVALFALQHSDTLGQWEASQTVLTRPSESTLRILANRKGSGALIFSHGGFAVSDLHRTGMSFVAAIIVIIGPQDLISLSMAVFEGDFSSDRKTS